MSLILLHISKLCDNGSFPVTFCGSETQITYSYMFCYHGYFVCDLVWWYLRWLQVFIISPPDMTWQVFFSPMFRIFSAIDIVNLWKSCLVDLGSDTCILHPLPCSWILCIFSSSDVCRHPFCPASTLSKRHMKSSTDPDNLWVEFDVDKHTVVCIPSVLNRMLLTRMEEALSCMALVELSTVAVCIHTRCQPVGSPAAPLALESSTAWERDFRWNWNMGNLSLTIHGVGWISGSFLLSDFFFTIISPPFSLIFGLQSPFSIG